ncbi:polysaccharide pyruvyl transferase family protein [Halomonas organivorans]
MSHKRIAVFGSYNAGSIGDTAILLGLISSIHRLYGDRVIVEVMVARTIDINNELKEIGVNFSVNEHVVFAQIDGNGGWVDKARSIYYRLKRKLFNQTIVKKKKVREVLGKCDVLVVGGGNLIMDLYPAWPPILKEVCEIARNSSVPYGFLGVGASPIKTSLGGHVLKECLEGARFVVYRDLYSKKYCEEMIGFYHASVRYDLAFGIERVRHDRQSVGADSLCVNLASVFSERWPERDSKKFDDYISGVIKLVDNLVKYHALRHVYVFNTNYPLDDIGAQEFLNRMSIHGAEYSVEYMSGKKTVKEIIDICSKAKVALVTRLHAGIISSIAGAQVVAIEYQPKVKDVLSSHVSNALVLSMDRLVAGGVEDVSVNINNVERNHGYSISSDSVDEMVKEFL